VPRTIFFFEELFWGLMEGQQEGAADLELLDPTPNIHQLFKHYNAKYFEGKLSSVKLRWDTNMKL